MQRDFCALILSAMALMAVATPGFAQKADDSYKPPASAGGGGLDTQRRAITGEPAPAPAPGQKPAAGGAAAPAVGGGGGGLVVRGSQGTAEAIKIAIPDFLGEDPKLAADMTNVITADLKRSGLFEPIDKAAFLDTVRDVNALPNFANWRQTKASALNIGRVKSTGDGRISAEFRLWDTESGKQLSGQSFAVPAQSWRRAAHIIADQIYEKLTGEKGYFDTRVVFVDETGSKVKRVKRLAIMDQDAANVRLLTQGQELVLTPRFSPTNQEIVYMSYARDQPRVLMMNLATGQKDVVGDFPGMTFAPRFSPDGQRIIMSLQNEGDSDLYEMDLRSKQTRQLTNAPGIDTGPCYSPDGRQVVFESDREGTQQLYVMNSDGSGPRRITFSEGRYSTPVWSPRGDYIAFTKQLQGRFLIGVIRPDGQGERILTEGFHNEGPTWAPNGRVLMFFREGQGAQGARIYSIDLTGYNEQVVQTPSFASDPAWSPVLN
jgi:TolB protein